MNIELTRIFEDLFVGRGDASWNEDVAQELRAVKDKRKGISAIHFDGDYDDLIVNERYNYLIRRSFDMDLIVVQHRILLSGIATYQTHVLVLLPEELWRVPAYIETLNALMGYSWCDAAEFFQSRILGYTVDETRNWIARHNERRLGWIGSTVYLLMDKTQEERLSSEGVSALVEIARSSAEPIRIVSSERIVVRKQLPADITSQILIARVAVKSDIVSKIVASIDEERVIWAANLDERSAALISQNTMSIMQFWENDSWR